MPVFESRAQMLASTAKAVDASHAEEIRISFMSGGILDVARPAVVIRAVLQSVRKDDVTPPAGMRTAVGATRTKLFIERSGYDGPMLVVGDSVRAIERRGKPAYEVAWVDDNNATRLIVELNER